ncbi:MAG: RNA 2',3'-cyclic phosphodiesterase [bacterium]
MKPRYDPRLFLGLTTSRTVQSKLEACQAEVRKHLFNWHFIPPVNFHVTLHFIGEVSESQIPEIDAAMRKLGKRSTPFTLEWHGIDFFGDPDNARVLFVGAKPCEEMGALAGQIAEIIPTSRVRKEYHPHITLAKARKQMEYGVKQMNANMLRRLREHNRIGPEPVTIEFNTVHREFMLMETVWVGRAVSYEVRSRYQLGGSEVTPGDTY